MSTGTTIKTTKKGSHKPLGFKSAATQAIIPLLRAYLECSDEMQESIHEMIEILEDPEAEDDDKLLASRTIEAILFPSYYGEALGVALTETEELAPDSKEAKSILAEMDKEEATFAERLEYLMGKKGITQTALAEAIGVGQPAVSMMLARHCRPQRRTVGKIADFLKVSPEDLWPGFKDI